MANELKFTAPRATFNKAGAATVDWNPGDISVTVTNSKVAHVVQNIGTTAEALVLGDIAAANNGYVCLRNLDPTNYVDLSLINDGSTPFARLNPGEFAVFRLTASATYYAKAHTAAINLEVVAVEN